MKISGGLSQISFHSGLDNKIGKESVYVWPLYNAGKVESIKSIARQTEQNAFYSKPAGEDMDKVLGALYNRDIEYTSTGRSISSKIAISNGSLFEAIA